MAAIKSVRILGMADNLSEMPPTPPGVEVWASNSHKGYRQKLPRILSDHEWTRWFNLHSRAHMDATYPVTVKEFYTKLDGSKPIYTQRLQPDFPGCLPFPGPEIQKFFGGTRYFTCSVTWLIAFAIVLGFDRIELWGFRLSDGKPSERWKVERPCFFYWVQEARNRGIDVWYQPEIEALPFIVGDPNLYQGPLYGYETKPEWSKGI